MASIQCFLSAKAALVLFILSNLHFAQVFSNRTEASGSFDEESGHHVRKLMTMFEPDPMWLSYRGGMIFTGSDIPVYIIWYGRFSPFQRSSILDFFASFRPDAQEARPSVSSWWALTSDYKDRQGYSVASMVEVKDEFFDDYSMGLYVAEEQIEGLLEKSFRSSFPTEYGAFYLVLTADDVYVDGFCTRRCASHFLTRQLTDSTGNAIKIPFAWVGNAATQCPGKCAWPFAKGDYGFDTQPLKAPSGDVGVEGMIINIATMLAGTATNPMNDGFFQGDVDLPLEAATACAGMFGQDAYSGFPGILQTESGTGASFNAYGINGHKYLLPALWNPSTSSCSHPL